MSTLGRALQEAADEIQRIVDGAERVAEEIRAGAESEADRYRERHRREVDEFAAERAREFAETLHGFADRLEGLRRENLEIAREVEEALRRIREAAPDMPGGQDADLEPASGSPLGGDGEDAEPPPSEIPRVAPAEPRAKPPDAAAAVSRPAPQAGEAAILRAAQLAVSGMERGEIEAVLRHDFGIQAPGTIVDEILGPAAGDTGGQQDLVRGPATGARWRRTD